MSQVANPFSTGGGGTSFEIRVKASFLVNMLVKGAFPCLPSGSAEYIRFQARQEGYNVDDIVLCIKDLNGIKYKLLAQIKHSLKISAADSTFREVITAAWNDYNNSTLFNKENDIFLFITQPLSTNFTENIRVVLDWARYCIDSSEFFNKLQTSKFSSETKRNYINQFKLVLDQVNGTPLQNDELWKILKKIYFIGYDFDSDSSVHKSLILSMIELAKNPQITDSPESIWGKLIDYTQTLDQNAGTITLDNIRPDIKSLFKSNFCIVSDQVISRLIEHGNCIIDAILDKIAGTLHIDRSNIVNEIIDIVKQNQIIVVTGVAGIGKSAIIKNLIKSISKDSPVFIFRAEEFNQPHLHNVMHNIGIQDSLKDLSSRFSLISEKIIIIDSIEKVFEFSDTSAFTQFLRMIVKDPSIKLIVGCRIHSVRQIEENFLFPYGLVSRKYFIPELSDSELEYVKDSIPSLIELTSNLQIKSLLRNPFYLREACKISWGLEGDISKIDESLFKKIIWENVIEKKTEQVRGLTIKRRNCFMDIALRRAKSMRISVTQGSCDAEALQKLIDDNIIVNISGGYAPAHDLFEDWALIKYIEDRFNEFQTNPAMFFQAVGQEPAMRRSFRIWLVEQIDNRNTVSINRFTTNCIKSQEVIQYWRDETIAAILLSNKSSVYLEQQNRELLKDNFELLIRFIHILRTACKAPDEYYIKMFGFKSNSESSILGTAFLKPIGSGWSSIIKFIYKYIDQIQNNHFTVIKELLKDFVSSIKKDRELPEAAKEAGLIALYYLESLKDCYEDDLKQEILTIAFKVTQVIKPELTAIFEEAISKINEDRYRHYENILDASLSSVYCAEVCEYLPNYIIKAAQVRWYKSNQKKKHMFDYEYSTDIDAYFGLSNIRRDYSPASSIQGPFVFLLNYHPNVAIDFIIKFINYCTSCYANSTLDKKYGDAPIRIKIILNNGKEIYQWGSQRLWCLYRGISVGPNIVQSALMALENWLFNMIESGSDICCYYDRLLQDSISVAITSVLVSVATAHYNVLGERVLSLLKTKEFYNWDLSRQVSEGGHIDDIRPLIGAPTGGIEDIHYEARKKASERKHRKYRLENLVLNLQTTKLRNDINKIIDDFYNELPPIEKQNDGHKIWRITLNRMDLRRYKAEEDAKEGIILLTPEEPEKDIIEFQEKNAPEIEFNNRQIRLLNWGYAEFEKNNNQTEMTWKEAFKEARELHNQILTKYENGNIHRYDGHVFVAAISIRDHFDEMNLDEKLWCINTLCDAVSEEMDSFNHLVTVSRFNMHGSRPAAQVLPMILGKFNQEMDDRIKYLIAGSLTHASEEVRAYAIKGVRECLWEVETEFAKACLYGLIEYARIQVSLQEYYHTLYNKYNEKERQRSIQAILNTKIELRKKIASNDIHSWRSIEALDFESYSTHDLTYALALIPESSKEEDHFKIYSIVFNELIRFTINLKRDKRYWRIKVDDTFSLEFPGLFSSFILHQDSNKALAIYEPLKEYMYDCPDLTADILNSLIYAEDRIYSNKTFWAIWSSMSEKAFSYPKLSIKNNEFYLEFDKVIKTLLFEKVFWKKEVKEWRTLNDNKNFIILACSKVGHFPAAFSALTKLFSSIGQVFLPEGFVWLSDAITRGVKEELLKDSNCVYYLEVILRNNIYVNERLIRSDMLLKNAIMLLLDALVDRGSSIAFQLREKIISPLPSSN